MGRGARKPKGFRDLDGILLLHKPIGISSNHALQKARHLFKANKAGHTGSLDPLASGMLPVCFGEATKSHEIILEVIVTKDLSQARVYFSVLNPEDSAQTLEALNHAGSLLAFEKTSTKCKKTTRVANDWLHRFNVSWPG